MLAVGYFSIGCQLYILIKKVMRLSTLKNEVVFRGQMYEGPRDKSYGERFVYGDADYYTTNFGDGCGYAIADAIQNRDLLGNIDLNAKKNGTEVAHERALMLARGNGRVYSSAVTTDKALVVGDGVMFDYSDIGVSGFQSICMKALKDCGVVDERIRMKRFSSLVKLNDNPVEANSFLIHSGLEALPNKIAEYLGADCIVFDTSITPTPTELKGLASHIMVLNPDIVKSLGSFEPLERPVYFGLPNEDFEAHNAKLESFLEECERVRSSVELSVQSTLSNGVKPFIAHRGQLYNGVRAKGYGANYGFGDAEYFSSFAVGSTYSSNDEAINVDLAGNVKHIAAMYDVDIEEAKDIVAPNGVGKVYSALVFPKKMMEFGGEKFVDIADEARFRAAFGLALAELDINLGSEQRDALVQYVIDKNDCPDSVMSKIVSMGAGAVLRQYASINLCDTIKIDAKIAPNHTIHKINPDADAHHYMVLDENIIKPVAVSEPVLMDAHLYQAELMPSADRTEKIHAHLQECRAISDEIEATVQRNFGIEFSGDNKTPMGAAFQKAVSSSATLAKREQKNNAKSAALRM